MSEFDDQTRNIRDAGLAHVSDMGEVMRFPDMATRKAIGLKYGLDIEDWETRKRNIEAFKRSQDYLRYKVYKKRLF